MSDLREKLNFKASVSSQKRKLDQVSSSPVKRRRSESSFSRPNFHNHDQSYKSYFQEKNLLSGRENFEFFFGCESPFSQQHPAAFVIDDTRFSCVEQYYMYRKAVLLEDKEAAKQIMNTTDPKEQARLGEQIQDSELETWDQYSRNVMKKGNKAKFSQNPQLKDKLLATAPRLLVQASPSDSTWGIGLDKDDPQAWDRRTWRGENLLGFTISEVREELMDGEKKGEDSREEEEVSQMGKVRINHVDNNDSVLSRLKKVRKEKACDNEEQEKKPGGDMAIQDCRVDCVLGTRKQHLDRPTSTVFSKDRNHSSQEKANSDNSYETGRTNDRKSSERVKREDSHSTRTSFSWRDNSSRRNDLFSREDSDSYSRRHSDFHSKGDHSFSKRGDFNSWRRYSEKFGRDSRGRERGRRNEGRRKSGRSNRGDIGFWSYETEGFNAKDNRRRSESCLPRLTPRIDNHNHIYKHYFEEKNLVSGRENMELFFGYQSPFSQHHPAKFEIDGKEFNCAEQYYMYNKAVIFENKEIEDKIMNSTNPKEQKRLGRQIENFDFEIWMKHSIDVVRRATRAKFTQNPHLQDELLDSAPRLLVEASPPDGTWGIGLGKDDPLAWNMRTWLGENLLGFTITEVRDELLRQESDSEREAREKRRGEEKQMWRSWDKGSHGRADFQRGGFGCRKGSSPHRFVTQTKHQRSFSMPSQPFYKINNHDHPYKHYFEEKNMVSGKEKLEVFFGWWSPFSQHHRAKFEIDNKRFNCAEQYFMYSQAVLFEDKEIQDKIMNSTNPMEQKRLGWQIENFDIKIWMKHSIDVVRRATRAKFSQNDDLKEKLFTTAPKLLVEANPHDHTWGIGLRKDNPQVWDMRTWRGENLLGFIITEIRDELMKQQLKKVQKSAVIHDKKKYVSHDSDDSDSETDSKKLQKKSSVGKSSKRSERSTSSDSEESLQVKKGSHHKEKDAQRHTEKRSSSRSKYERSHSSSSEGEASPKHRAGKSHYEAKDSGRHRKYNHSSSNSSGSGKEENAENRVDSKDANSENESLVDVKSEVEKDCEIKKSDKNRREHESKLEEEERDKTEMDSEDSCSNSKDGHDGKHGDVRQENTLKEPQSGEILELGKQRLNRCLSETESERQIEKQMKDQIRMQKTKDDSDTVTRTENISDEDERKTNRFSDKCKKDTEDGNYVVLSENGQDENINKDLSCGGERDNSFDDKVCTVDNNNEDVRSKGQEQEMDSVVCANEQEGKQMVQSIKSKQGDVTISIPGDVEKEKVIADGKFRKKQKASRQKINQRHYRGSKGHMKDSESESNDSGRSKSYKDSDMTISKHDRKTSRQESVDRSDGRDRKDSVYNPDKRYRKGSVDRKESGYREDSDHRKDSQYREDETDMRESQEACSRHRRDSKEKQDLYWRDSVNTEKSAEITQNRHKKSVVSKDSTWEKDSGFRKYGADRNDDWDKKAVGRCSSSDGKDSGGRKDKQKSEDYDVFSSDCDKDRIKHKRQHCQDDPEDLSEEGRKRRQQNKEEKSEDIKKQMKRSKKKQKKRKNKDERVTSRNGSEPERKESTVEETEMVEKGQGGGGRGSKMDMSRKEEKSSHDESGEEEKKNNKQHHLSDREQT